MAVALEDKDESALEEGSETDLKSAFKLFLFMRGLIVGLGAPIANSMSPF